MTFNEARVFAKNHFRKLTWRHGIRTPHQGNRECARRVRQAARA